MSAQSIAARTRWVAFGALLLLAGTAQAQRLGDGFFFRDVRGTLGVHGGFALANAGSDLFSFTTGQLTLNKIDFSAPSFGADIGIRASRRFDLVFGFDYAGRSTPSEFRDWVDQNDLPIRQTTSFRRLPVTASVKAYLTPRGRSIGRFAWIPAKSALYAGLGGGAMWYEFSQDGDFVDFETLAVFGDTFKSSGWAPEAHGMLGFEFSLNPRFLLTAEGRYTWARASLSRDFDGFQPLDLSGAAATMGVAFRF